MQNFRKSRDIETHHINGTHLDVTTFSTHVIKSKDRYISIKVPVRGQDIDLRNSQIWINDKHVANVLTVIKKDTIAFLIVDRVLDDYHGQKAIITIVN